MSNSTSSTPETSNTPNDWRRTGYYGLIIALAVLFGLHRAKQAHQKRIVVMEGYTDVIACHLAGFCGAVASLGTAFTVSIGMPAPMPLGST